MSDPLVVAEINEGGDSFWGSLRNNVFESNGTLFLTATDGSGYALWAYQPQAVDIPGTRIVNEYVES